MLHIKVLDHIYPPFFNSSQIHPHFPFHQILYPFFVPTNANLQCPDILEYVVLHWNVVSLTNDCTFREY